MFESERQRAYAEREDKTLVRSLGLKADDLQRIMVVAGPPNRKLARVFSMYVTPSKEIEHPELDRRLKIQLRGVGSYYCSQEFQVSWFHLK
jgi:hypothetical protein